MIIKYYFNTTKFAKIERVASSVSRDSGVGDTLVRNWWVWLVVEPVWKGNGDNSASSPKRCTYKNSHSTSSPGYNSLLPLSFNCLLNQWFSIFLMLQPLNTTLRVVVTLNHKTISLLIHNCNFSTIMNHNVSDMQNIWYEIPMKGSFKPLP